MTTYVFDAVRSAFGRLGRGLAEVRPDDLAAGVMSSLMTRHPDIPLESVNDVIVGDANQAGEDNRNVARMALLLAGFPTSVPGTTVNRLCSSGMEAVVQGARAIDTGDAEVIVAGGVESMTRAPWVLPKPGRAYPASNATIYSSTLGWRMVNPAMDSRWTISNGESAEILAERFSISREAQDAFAVRSHRLAHEAWIAGAFDSEVVAVEGSDLVRDEGIRTDTTVEGLSGLKPAFRETGGTVTAGNSSQLSDGAAMLLLGGEKLAKQNEPLARIVSRAVVGNDPDVFGIAPVEAANRALDKAGKSWSDVDLVEINEAFAAQSLACLQGWPEVDPEIVNIHGGAIAIGHPLGASGARIVGHLSHQLAERGSGVAVAAICIGVGQGMAVVLER